MDLWPVWGLNKFLGLISRINYIWLDVIIPAYQYPKQWGNTTKHTKHIRIHNDNEKK